MQNLHLQGENALNSNTVADISAKTNSSLANQTRREFLSKGVKMAGAFGALSLGINSAFAAEKKTNSNKGAKMQTIFITGSNSGIGKATALLLAQKGWQVIATMRDVKKAGDLAQHKNIVVYPLDITNVAQVKDTAKAVLSKYEVDVLFNNAGYGMKARFEDMSEETMFRSINTNILGMVRVTQQFIPHFKKRRKGTILTTTSLAGEMGLVLDGVYAADKWAQTGICEMLYSELAPYNIVVKTIVPGVVKTNFQMDTSSMSGYEKMIANQRKILMPDINDIQTAEEVAQDIYTALTDGGNSRMAYPTGKVCKELYQKRQEMGDEKFRTYIRGLLMA